MNEPSLTFIIDRRRRTAFAIHDGKSIAYVDYTFDDGIIEIAMIKVDANMRRKKVATRLLKYLKRELKATKIDWGETTTDGLAFKRNFK